jgi:xanthine dehydrogenase accessory factor
VSGGCLEGDVTRRAWFLKNPGERELIRYDTGSGDDATYEFGLGCRGVVDIVIERLELSEDPEVIRMLRDSVETRAASTLRIDLATIPRASTDPIERLAPVYEERITPPIQLVILGSGADTLPLVRIASELGWGAVVVDAKLARSRDSDGTRYVAEAPSHWRDSVRIDTRTACVLMTHRMKDDAGYLADVLKSDAGYIGCLGPASRTEALIDELALAGITLTDEDRRRIHAPVGLDLGAERPEEIALAIIAEIAAAMTGAAGGSLRAREGPIHLKTIAQRVQ